MREREWKTHSLHADELGGCKFLFGLAVASLFQNLGQSSPALGFLKLIFYTMISEATHFQWLANFKKT